jgi:hypothetical protein
VPAQQNIGDQVKTGWERAEEKRQAKLDLVQEQVASGSLVIRQMTDEERSKNQPRPPKPGARPRRSFGR